MSASPIEDELNFLTEEPVGPVTLGIIDEITKTIDGFLKTVVCSLDVIGNLVKETDFNKDYEKFRAAMEALVKEVETCMNGKGLKGKVK